MAEFTLLTTQDDYDKGAAFAYEPEPTALDCFTPDGCPDKMTLSATMMFTLTALEQFIKGGYEYDEAILALDHYLDGTTQDDLTSRWVRMGDAFVVALQENGAMDTAELVHTADPSSIEMQGVA